MPEGAQGVSSPQGTRSENADLSESGAASSSWGWLERTWFLVTGEHVREAQDLHLPPLPKQPDPPEQLWQQILAAKNRTGSAGLPKTALLFLTRGRIPFESVWEAFLQGLDMQTPGMSTFISQLGLAVHSVLDVETCSRSCPTAGTCLPHLARVRAAPEALCCSMQLGPCSCSYCVVPRLAVAMQWPLSWLSSHLNIAVVTPHSPAHLSHTAGRQQ